MADLSERVTALEVARVYETKAGDQDRAVIMAHSKRLHHAEAAIQNILVNGARRDRKLGYLEAVAREARKINDRILFAKASGKYLIAATVIVLFLSGRLSSEQVEVIRAWFTAS